MNCEVADMSSETDSGGRPSATTVSTVAVQTGDSRIVVAILKASFLFLKLTLLHCYCTLI